MGTKYSSQSQSGYNSSAPPDDGSVSASNKVSWAFVKSKIGDPVLTLAQAINSALVTFTNFGSRAVTATDSIATSDHMKTIEASGTFTESLPDATATGAGFIVSVRNTSSGAITVALTTATDTLNGTANGSMLLDAGCSAIFKTNAAATGYYTISVSPMSVSSTGAVTFPNDVAVNGGDLTSTATTFNLLNSTVTTINAFSAATSASLGANAGNFTVRGVLSGTFKPRVNLSYTPGDTTPSVLDSGILSIANSGAVTITQFDDGVTGQLIYLFFEDANTTINRANCVLAGGVNFTSSANDILVLIKTATVWAEVCRSVNA